MVVGIFVNVDECLDVFFHVNVLFLRLRDFTSSFKLEKLQFTLFLFLLDEVDETEDVWMSIYN